MTNDKDGAALVPCPFCGGDAVMRRDDDPGYPWYVTFEHEPDCTMYALPTDMFRSFSTEAEAIAAWNRRAALQSHGQAFDAAGVREAREVIAYSVIEGSAGIRAAELAKDSQTRNWSDALRSADAVIANLAAPASVEPVAGDVLMCDVKLPPATTVRAGCSFDTLRLAISAPGRPRHFDEAEPDTIATAIRNQKDHDHGI